MLDIQATIKTGRHGEYLSVIVNGDIDNPWEFSARPCELKTPMRRRALCARGINYVASKI